MSRLSFVFSFKKAFRGGPGVLALAACLAAGCGGGGENAANAPGGAGGVAPEKRIKLLFVTNSDADWWNAVEKGMEDASKTNHCDVEMKRNGGKTDGQIRILEDALSRSDIQGVAVSVLEPNAPGIADAMRELRKSGKVVITIDSDGLPDTRSAYIGTVNRKAGEAAGRAAKALRPQGGETAVFVGVASAANAIERSEGFFAGAGPAFKQIEVFEDGNDFVKAQSNVQSAITKHPNVGVLLGLWSYNAPRIAEEANKRPEVRKKVTVVTFDLDELTIPALEKGEIDVSVVQNPYTMGLLAVRLLKAYIEKDKDTIDSMLPKGTTSIDTGVRIVVPTKDSPVKGDDVIDIEGMKAFLASKGLKSS